MPRLLVCLTILHLAQYHALFLVKKSTLLTLKKFTKTGFCGQILGTLSERTAATNDSLGTAARLRMRWRVL